MGERRQHFEHVIQVNDPRTGIPPVARVELWKALVFAATSPAGFQPAIDHARVEATAESHWRRELRFGTLAVGDEIHADARRGEIRQQVTAPPELAGQRRTLAIESPAPGHLVVRFVYEGAPGEPAAERAAREGAWLVADRDLVARIRQLHAVGGLDLLED
jgi:hypothetical protein